MKGKLMDTPKEETSAELEARREQLTLQCGVKQFNEAISAADRLQMNQQILDINNKLNAKHAAAVGSPIKIVPEENVEVEPAQTAQV